MNGRENEESSTEVVTGLLGRLFGLDVFGNDPAARAIHAFYVPGPGAAVFFRGRHGRAADRAGEGPLLDPRVFRSVGHSPAHHRKNSSQPRPRTMPRAK